MEAGTFLAAVVLTLVGNLIARNPGRPPSLIIILCGVFVLTVGSMALSGLTTLAGDHFIESVHDLEMFCLIAGVLTFGLIIGTAISSVTNRRFRHLDTLAFAENC